MPSLKTGMKNDIFRSEIGSGFGEPGGTPPPRIPRSTPRGILAVLRRPVNGLQAGVLYIFNNYSSSPNGL